MGKHVTGINYASKLYTFVAILILSTAAEISNNGREPPQPLQRSNIVTLDLSKCTCTTEESLCDLTITKSRLVTTTCSTGEHLCCSTVKTEPTNMIPNLPIDTYDDNSEKPSSNVRIYAINPYFNKEQTSKTSPEDDATSQKMKPKKNCRCKPRSSCPQNYIDYGFGFHCSYNTVRCCIPDEEVEDLAEEVPTETLASTAPQDTPQDDTDATLELQNESEVNTEGDNSVEFLPPAEQDEVSNENSVQLENEKVLVDQEKNEHIEGELLITEITDQWNENDFQKDGECFCLAPEKCRKLETNAIDRRDTLCPLDLIQCCGSDVIEEIMEKKDDDNVNINQGSPPYEQPIQLLNSKIPVEEAPEMTHDVGPSQQASLPPPVLPNQYHSYEPTTYNRGYNYPPNSYPGQLSGPQNYQKGGYLGSGQNIRPWVSLSSPSSYPNYPPPPGGNNYQGYPRGPYPDDGNSRSSKPSGLFDTLKQMIG